MGKVQYGKVSMWVRFNREAVQYGKCSIIENFSMGNGMEMVQYEKGSIWQYFNLWNV